MCAFVAQQVEHLAVNQRVVGSSPAEGAIFLDRFKFAGRGIISMGGIVTISKAEYVSLKKKAEFVDDVLLQLDASLHDAEKGKIKKAIH